jgi:rieske iron-sulfur protein
MSDDVDETRRRLLKACIGIGAGLAGASMLSVATGLRTKVSLVPASAPPQAGDVLVFAEGARQGERIGIADVLSGGPGQLAWPCDPRANVTRNARRDNLVVLVRAGASDWFDESTRAYAVGDVVAYSAICTHLCCTVSAWTATPPAGGDRGALVCPCHKTAYDPWHGAAVQSGPAPRPLSILPLVISDAGLAVAGSFVGRVGC